MAQSDIYGKRPNNTSTTFVKKWDRSVTALLTNSSSLSSRVCEGIFSIALYPVLRISPLFSCYPAIKLEDLDHFLSNKKFLMGIIRNLYTNLLRTKDNQKDGSHGHTSTTQQEVHFRFVTQRYRRREKVMAFKRSDRTYSSY